jgi:hypothetical protein
MTKWLPDKWFFEVKWKDYNSKKIDDLAHYRQVFEYDDLGRQTELLQKNNTRYVQFLDVHSLVFRMKSRSSGSVWISNLDDTPRRLQQLMSDKKKAEYVACLISKCDDPKWVERFQMARYARREYDHLVHAAQQVAKFRPAIKYFQWGKGLQLSALPMINDLKMSRSSFLESFGICVAGEQQHNEWQLEEDRSWSYMPNRRCLKEDCITCPTQRANPGGFVYVWGGVASGQRAFSQGATQLLAAKMPQHRNHAILPWLYVVIKCAGETFYFKFLEYLGGGALAVRMWAYYTPTSNFVDAFELVMNKYPFDKRPHLVVKPPKAQAEKQPDGSAAFALDVWNQVLFCFSRLVAHCFCRCASKESALSLLLI